MANYSASVLRTVKQPRAEQLILRVAWSHCHVLIPFMVTLSCMHLYASGQPSESGPHSACNSDMLSSGMQQMNLGVTFNAVARQMCRDAGVSWAGAFCNSMHVPPRLRKALQGHLCHLAGLRPQKRRKHRLLAPAKRREGVSRFTSHEAAAEQEADQASLTLEAQLQQCACTGDTSQLKQVLQQHTMDINQQVGPQGRTALHAAAEHGHAAMCSTLLQLGADIYQYDGKQVSALMLAAKNGHHQAVKASGSGLGKAWGFVAMGKTMALLLWLTRASSKQKRTLRAYCVYLQGFCEVLLDAGADAFAVDESGTNALLLAASSGSATCIQLLLQEGYVDADYSNHELGAGEHALLLAAAGGHADCVAVLLAAGAKVNRTDKEGRTALWVASRAGHLDVINLLLSKPRTKHIRHFFYGTTPIMEAQSGEHPALVSLLAALLAQQQPVQQHWGLPQLPEVQERPVPQQHTNSTGSSRSKEQRLQPHEVLGVLPLPELLQQQQKQVIGSQAGLHTPWHQQQRQSQGSKLQQCSKPVRDKQQVYKKQCRQAHGTRCPRSASTSVAADMHVPANPQYSSRCYCSTQ